METGLRAMGIEHRRDKRTHVFLRAMLRSVAGEMEVKLTNLSSLGACADYPAQLAPGEEVYLWRGDLTVPGRVAWAENGRIGVEFSRPLDVEAFRSQGRPTADNTVAALHQPVKRLSPQLQRHWAKILSQ